MKITEIRVKLVGNNEERLKAFCSVTLDGSFVIRDLKVIDGANGPFVAMPSRKLSDRCPKCGGKNHYRAKFCNECGNRLDPNRAPRDDEGRVKLHADVAHPINAAGREQIQREVIEAFEREAEAAQMPDYVQREVDFDDLGDTEYEDFIAEIKESVGQKQRGDGGRSKEADDRTAVGTERRQARSAGAVGTDARTARPKDGRSAESERDRQPPTQDDPFSAGIL